MCVKVPAAVTDTPVLAENLARIPLPLEIAGESTHNQKCKCERNQRQKEVIMQSPYLCLASTIPWLLHCLDIVLVLVLLLDVIQILMFQLSPMRLPIGIFPLFPVILQEKKGYILREANHLTVLL